MAPSSAAPPAGWLALGAPPAELDLDCTLPTGQSFRWRRLPGGDYVGVVGQRALRLRAAAGDVWYRVLARGAAPGAAPDGDEAALRDYFNLGGHAPLAQLAAGWAAADPHFASVHPYLQGARMLRQDPMECLFSFICSQNNHISRIHGMVDRLCTMYGTPLPTALAGGEEGAQAGGPGQHAEGSAAAAPEGGGAAGGPLPEPQPRQRLHAFPSLRQLAAAREDDLRAAGFGYRASYVVGAAARLAGRPGGGEAWLAGLRAASYEDAARALCELPGVGPKVAACVCLFSLDKHEAIPVDTHVWQLAVRHYTPHLRGKSLTSRVHNEVQAAFVARFGPYAGWAHNTLFISELASLRDRLPAKRPAKQPAKRAAEASAGAGAEQPPTPQPAAEPEAGQAGRPRRRRRAQSQA